MCRFVKPKKEEGRACKNSIDRWGKKIVVMYSTYIDRRSVCMLGIGMQEIIIILVVALIIIGPKK